MITLVLTLLGPDRPGLVEAIAREVLAEGGNWLESRMCHLGGQFAGILRVEVDPAKRATLERRLEALGRLGLRIVAHADEEAAPGAPASPARLELVAQDRPGIVSQISSVLARHGVNVEELHTGCESAPMSGEMLFRAQALLHLPAGVAPAALRAELEKLAADLMAEVTLE